MSDVAIKQANTGTFMFYGGTYSNAKRGGRFENSL